MKIGLLKNIEEISNEAISKANWVELRVSQ